MQPIDDGIAIPPKGRTSGSKNKATAQRDAAIVKGRKYREGGMTLELAASKVTAEFRLNITERYVAQLIAGSK